MDDIARGEAYYEEVLYFFFKINNFQVKSFTIRNFYEKFLDYTENIEKVNSVFQASFTPIASAGRRFDKVKYSGAGSSTHTARLENVTKQVGLCSTLPHT